MLIILKTVWGLAANSKSAHFFPCCLSIWQIVLFYWWFFLGTVCMSGFQWFDLLIGTLVSMTCDYTKHSKSGKNMSLIDGSSEEHNNVWIIDF